MLLPMLTSTSTATRPGVRRRLEALDEQLTESFRLALTRPNCALSALGWAVPTPIALLQIAAK